MKIIWVAMRIEHIWFGSRQLVDCLFASYFSQVFLCFISFPSIHSVRLTFFFCIIFNGSFHKYRMCNYFRQYLHKSMKMVGNEQLNWIKNFCKPQFRISTMYQSIRTKDLKRGKNLSSAKKKSEFNKIYSPCLTLSAPCSKAKCIRFSLSIESKIMSLDTQTLITAVAAAIAVAGIERVWHRDTLNVIIKHVLPPMWMLMCNFIL